MSKPITNYLTKTIALATAVFAGGMLTAHAQPFSGSSSGIFNDPVGGVDNPAPVYTGMGSSSITFGDGDGYGTGPNALTFTGASFSTVPAETLFDVGTLNYFNGTTTTGTTLDSVGLNVSLTLTIPAVGAESFEFPLTITTTPNTGTDAQNADYITLPVASSTTFTVGADTYTLKLSFGEFTGGGFIDPDDGTFRVYEGDSATAPVEGIITTDLSGVPDSGSTMLLLGGAGTLLCWLRRSSGRSL